jgi:ATP-dependent protease ClpP protease subunit
MSMYTQILRAFERAPADMHSNISALKLPQTLDVRAQDNGSYDLMLYDVIGCGCIAADDVAMALAVAGGAPLRVRINSPGGDAFDGFAIYNLLASYDGDVSVLIDGIAASAASYVAMAADTVEMQPASFMMIHNGWTIAVGDKGHLQTQISALSKIDETQAKIFAGRTGLETDEIAAMLAAETWFTSDEAVMSGFADGIFGEDDDDLDASDSVAEVEISAQAMSFDIMKRKRVLQARLLNSATLNKAI